MAITLADREGRPLSEGDVVTYHGSLWGEHGEWEVHGPCSGCPSCHWRWEQGEPLRMRLIRLTNEPGELDCVSPASVTLAGHPLPERDGVTVLGQARDGDVIVIDQWPYQLTVDRITPAGGPNVLVRWSAPDGLSGVFESTGEAPAELAVEGEN